MNRRPILLAALLLTVFVAGIASAEERAIVPVAGSTAGANGSNFRTEMQLHNPGSGVMRGSIVFLPQAAGAKAVPHSTLEYEIGAKKTLRYADVIATLGASGLGSLDVVATEGALPKIVVRAFDDQGNFGTRGLVVPAVRESEVPVIGYRFVLVAPSNVETYRFNIGVRTLGASAARLRVTEHDAAGATVGESFELTYAGETFRQNPAAELLGRAIVAGHSYSFETLSGSAIVYATTVDNKSNDGALQLDRPVNRPPVAADLAVTTGKDEAKTVTIDAIDPDGDPLTFKELTGPAHGTLSGITVEESIAPKASASLVYTPESGYQGPDTFTIGVEDDVNGRDSATVQVSVGVEAGAAPTAVDDFYGVVSGDTLTVAAPGVLANDNDPEGGALVAQLVTGPLFGSAFTLHADGSFDYVPIDGFTGADSFTYQVSDGGNLSNVAKAKIFVGSPNQAPSAVPDTAATDEDTPISIVVLANDTDAEGDVLSVATVNTTGTLGAVTIGGGGNVNYSPTGSAVLQALTTGGSATDTFSYTVQDTNGGTATGMVTVTVSGIDDTPVAVADAATLLEDAAATAVNVLANDTDVDGGAITVTGLTQGTNGAVVITGGGTGLTYQPNSNFCGADSFTYTINGGSTATVSVTVTCVNDVPSFTAGTGPTVLEDSGAYSGAIASGVSAGPASESGQTLTFNVTANTNAALFGVAPAIDAAGNLTFTPAANANGSANITITLQDNGGTANGGVDTSASQGFTITVTAVNDVPSFTKGADETVLEGSGAHSVNGWATALSTGPADEAGQTLTFNVTGNTNAALFSAGPAIDAAGNLTYTLVADASGTATITITLQDNGGTANGGVDTSAAQTFDITVTDVNDAPSFTPAVGPTVLEDSGAYAAAWATAISRGPSPFEDGQTLTFNVTNNTNPSLFSVAPAIDATTGNLSFTPAANANGTADITITLQDNGGTANGGVDTSGPQTFTITVTAVNDVPSFTEGADQTVLEGVGPQTVNGWATAISKGPADESGQTLTFNVTGNTNAAMFSAGPAIDASGNLTYTLVADASGTATITITLQDNGGTANSGVDTSAPQSFDINVTDINDAPSFTTGGPVTVNEDSGAYNAAWATAISKGPSPFEDGQTLTFNITNNTNVALFSVAPAISAAGVLTFTPAANAFGTADITVALQDNGGTASGGVDTSAPVTFTINVTSQNDPPAANGDSASVDEGSGATAIDVLANDSFLPDASETLTITSVTQPAGGTVVITGGGTGLTFQPNANFAGGTTFTYTINDGTPASDATATVTMTVNPVNDAPSNTVPGVQSVDQLLTLTFPGNISIADVDAFTPQVTLSVDSGTLTLSGTTGLSFGTGDGTADATMQFTGTIAAINAALNGMIYDPVDSFEGAVTFNTTTNDLGQTGLGGALQDSDDVTINVTAINDPPVNALPAAQSTNEETTLTLSTATTNLISISDPDAAAATVQVALTATNGTLSLFGTTGLSFVFTDVNGTGAGDGTADATMTFRGTTADINTALNGLQFIPTPNYAGAASIQIVTNDLGNTGTGGVQSDSDPLTITVNPVNDAPAGASNTINGNEDVAYLFTAADFGFTDPNDTPANLLQSVVITTLPASGSLTLSGGAFAAGTEITLADINGGNLQFLGATSASGTPYASFTFQVRDDGGTANGGVDLDASPNTMTINLAPVNDAPAGTDNSISGTEDAQYTFTAADFGFSDPNDTPANALQSVRITTLPGAGSLTLSGGGFAAGTSIAVGDITAGNLKFLGAAQGTGSPYTTFTFQVQDDGGTANGGVDLDPSANTMTINLTAVNDAPAGTNGSVTGTEETLYTFTATDFGFTDPNDTPANALQSVVITTLPGSGSLTLSGGGFAAGTEITVADINLGNLKFLGAVNASGSPYTTFTFQVRDDGGTAGGGVDLDASANTLTINLTAVNDAPAGTNSSVTGLEETQYTFTATDFGFTDPNDTPANALASVVITTLPGSGSLTLSGGAFAAGTEISLANITAGNLQFLGATDGSGSPYTSFTFQVRDDGGTASGGVDLDPTPNTLTVNLTGVNDAPAGTDSAVTGDEDVLYTFTAANFGFTDPNDSPANALQSVVISTLPGAGSLTLSGAGFAAGTEISLANITAGNLKFLGASNAFGSPYSSFTFRVRDNGGTANGGVDLDATPNTMTISLNPVNDAPTVKNENGLALQDPAWQTIGNTELRVDMVAGTTPNVSDATPNVHPTYEGLIDNDDDVEGDPIAITAIGSGCGDLTAPFDCTLASGAFVHVDANGEFSFTPGPADTTDTFTYTVTDTPALGSPASTVGTVVINMSSRVWYVKNDALAGGLGGSTDPFDTLVEAQTASVAGDTIYVYFGDGTTNGQTAGIILKDTQRLIGAGVALTVPVSVNGGPNPTPLVVAGSRPLIDNVIATGGIDAGVLVDATAAARTGIEIRGLNIRGNENAIDATSTGANAIGVTIDSNTIRGTGVGFEGIDINQGSTALTSAAIITNNTWDQAGTHPGNAIDAARTAGTISLNISDNTNILSTGASGIVVTGVAAANTFITGFANNTVHQNTFGTGIIISNVTFDGTPGGAYQQVSGGTTVVGASGNGVGTAGVVMNPVAGDLAFTDLDIFADNGAGLAVTGTGLVNTGAGTGTRVTVGAAVGVIEATNGPAVSLTSLTTDLQLTSLKSTNSPTTGVALNGIAGTFSAGSGSAISGVTSAAGTSFQVGSSNATISYAGTINSTTGKGVDLTTNTGSTISFTGLLTMSSGTNTTFNATGGGTVTASNTASTLVSTTGTALNVANTTIGAAGLKFLSISANGGANGIVLNTTGALGGLAVSGTGATDASGGTIQSTTGRGASFISASNISLKNMNFTNAGTNDLDGDNSGLSTGDNLATNAAIHLQSVTGATTLDNLNINGGAEQGINGNTVANFTLSNSSIVNAGNEPDEDGIHFFNMSGTSAITNTTINCTVVTPNTTGGDDHLNLQMQSGSLNLTISGGSATNANKGSGYLFGIRGTANATITFTSASSTTNFSGGIVADAFDTATMNLTVGSSTSSGNNDQLSVSAGDSSIVNLSATGNTLSSTSTGDFVVIGLLGSALDTGYDFDAIISGNTITVANGLAADGVVVNNVGGANMDVAITNNTFDYAGTQRAILVQAGQDGAAASSVTITGNNIDIKLDGAGNAVAGILAQASVASPTGDGASLCADIGGAGALKNTFTHSLGGSMAGGDIRARQRLNGTMRLPGYGGGATDTAAVIAFLSGRNTVVSAPTATADSTGFAGGAACGQPTVP